MFSTSPCSTRAAPVGSARIRLLRGVITAVRRAGLSHRPMAASGGKAQGRHHDQRGAQGGSSGEFAGSTLPELQAWLESSGINTSAYGKAASKSMDLLWEEVQEGETVLTVSEEGAPLRLVNVVNVLITNSEGKTLTEAQQVLPSGTIRPRNKPLSEKLLPGEPWPEGVLRGIREELGGILPEQPAIVIDEGSHEEVVEQKESQSYPGLRSKYVCHRVRATVAGLPEGDFVTEEERSDGKLQHIWRWE